MARTSHPPGDAPARIAAVMDAEAKEHHGQVRLLDWAELGEDDKVVVLLYEATTAGTPEGRVLVNTRLAVRPASGQGRSSSIVASRWEGM